MWASSPPFRLSAPCKEERRGKGEAKKEEEEEEKMGKKRIGLGNPLGEMDEVGKEE